MPKQRVVVGMLGTTLDRGFGAKRWHRWRPTVAAALQPGLPVDRLELLHPAGHEGLARRIADDIAARAPATVVRCHALPPHDPWELEATYDLLAGVFAELGLDEDRDDLLVHISTGTHIVQICLFLMVETRQLPGRLLQTAPGGEDPVVGQSTVIDLNLRRYDRIHRRFEAQRVEATGLLKDGIDTRNPAFNRLIDEIERVAVRSTAPILILGPTGAGKSALAKRIAALKRARGRLSGAMVELNCATLRGDAAMSALFGHVKGAFTGALSARPGLLRAADGGLLFLDEIGELGLDEQAMLLRALEEGRFFPMGSDREAESQFQLIAGTNVDLSAAVAAGRFRGDLLARIHTWTFRLPGLAERPEDIEPNLDHELRRQGAGLGRRLSMNREARARFLAFARAPEARWTGNFRDLAAAALRMGTLAESGRIDVPDVVAEEERLRAAWGPPPAAPRPGPTGEALLEALLSPEAALALDPFDAVQLAYVLGVCAQAESQSAAGRALFAKSRLLKTSTNDADRLRKYLQRFGIDWAQVQAAR